ncbi:Putative oxidoreductase [Mycobacterium tuberculosis]|uniref:Oxidoreductase n=1 Tax=Mycobacterium tuberculosis TaxID=1773 RepID=A0A655JNN6_MYCTX|nr:Putative oxidoreductase [Mycobacterium tuberculosis]
MRVLAGQVDRRGRIIEGDNEMLVCVSRAVSGRVVIDA